MKPKTFKKNISWIFVGNSLHAVLSFIINIIVARALTKEDYGIINYVASWISFFNAFALLGLNNVINKYLDDDLEKNNKYLSSAIYARIISSIISMILVCLILLLIESGNKQIFFITLIYSLSYLAEIGNIFVYWFRYKREANIVAILRIIAFMFSAIVKMLALFLYKSLYLYTFGIIFETLCFSILLFWEYNKRYKFKMATSKSKIKEMLKSSYPFIFSSLLVTIYAQTDKIMLKRMISSSEVASYSVALTIAGIVSIFASAVIEGFRPEIISSFNKNKDIYFKRLRQLYCFIFWLCIAYGAFITIFSKPIIAILYGDKYLSAQPVLSLIVWYTSFSYFGAVNNLYMVAESKEKWVQLNTLVGALTNIILNFILIPKMGIIGAALASLLTQVVANFLILLVIKDLRPLIPSIFKGILFRDVFKFNRKEERK